MTPEQARQANYGPWEFHTEKWSSPISSASSHHRRAQERGRSVSGLRRCESVRYAIRRWPFVSEELAACDGKPTQMTGTPAL